MHWSGRLAILDWSTGSYVSHLTEIQHFITDVTQTLHYISQLLCEMAALHIESVSVITTTMMIGSTQSLTYHATFLAKSPHDETTRARLSYAEYDK